MTDWRDTHQRQDTRPGGLSGTINCTPYCARCNVPWPCPTADRAERDEQPDTETNTPPAS
jgi:hypothetical protein